MNKEPRTPAPSEQVFSCTLNKAAGVASVSSVSKMTQVLDWKLLHAAVCLNCTAAPLSHAKPCWCLYGVRMAHCRELYRFCGVETELTSDSASAHCCETCGGPAPEP